MGHIGTISPPWARSWDLSPDGSRLALVDSHAYGGVIKLLAISDGTWHDAPVEAAAGNLLSIAWTADGNGFFAISKNQGSVNLSRVTPAGKILPLLMPEGYQNQSLAYLLASPNGRYLAFLSQVWDGNVWMIDNF